jgi:hypothetical protein
MRNGARVILKSKKNVKENTGEMYVYGNIVIHQFPSKFCEAVMLYQIAIKKRGVLMKAC